MTTHKLSTDDLLALSNRLIQLVEDDYVSHWVLPKKFVQLFDEDDQDAAKIFYEKVATSYKNIEDLTTLSASAHLDWHRDTFIFTENAIVYNTAVYIYKDAHNRGPSRLLHDWSKGSYGKKGRLLAIALKIVTIVYVFVFAPWLYSLGSDSPITQGVLMLLWLLPIVLIILVNNVVKIPRKISL